MLAGSHSIPIGALHGVRRASLGLPLLLARGWRSGGCWGPMGGRVFSYFCPLGCQLWVGFSPDLCWCLGQGRAYLIYLALQGHRGGTTASIHLSFNWGSFTKRLTRDKWFINVCPACHGGKKLMESKLKWQFRISAYIQRMHL